MDIITTLSSNPHAGATHPSEAQSRTPRHGEQRLFKLLFLVSFPVFLFLTLVTRWLPGSEAAQTVARPSLIAEAAEAACSTIAIVLNV